MSGFEALLLVFGVVGWVLVGVCVAWVVLAPVRFVWLARRGRARVESRTSGWDGGSYDVVLVDGERDVWAGFGRAIHHIVVVLGVGLVIVGGAWLVLKGMWVVGGLLLVV